MEDLKTFTQLLVSIGYTTAPNESTFIVIGPAPCEADDEASDDCDCEWCDLWSDDWDGTMGSEKVEDAMYEVASYRFDHAMASKVASGVYACEAGQNAVADLVEYMAVDMAGELDFYIDYIPAEHVQVSSFDSTEFTPWSPNAAVT